METVVASTRLKDDTQSSILINRLKDRQVDFGLGDAVIYYDFPTFKDYDEDAIRPDVMILSPIHGIIAVRILTPAELENGDESVQRIDQDLVQFNSMLFSRLVKSRLLRKSRRDLVFPIETYLLTDQRHKDNYQDLLENETICSDDVPNIFASRLQHSLDDETFNEARSIIEGAKALGKPKPRLVEKGDTTSKAAILAALESEIANFDVNQRSAAISLIDGPQRIRGLAGSGKTVILAMKAAHIHLNHPEKSVLITFYTKSLYAHIKTMVTRFYRHWKEEDPNWSKIHIRHAWGGQALKGVYSQACVDHGVFALSFQDARNKADPFGYICADLLEKADIKPKYDNILIDEAQDFPNSFFQLCYFLAKGSRDEKSIVWAYDELQNIINVTMRKERELFGLDDDGEARVDLARANAKLPEYLENDIVLHKCYRNPRVLLTCAHALGFGIYADKPVQMLQGKRHWEDVGYEVRSGNCIPGENTVVFRPESNSPLSISERQKNSELIMTYKASSLDEEIDWCKSQVVSFLSDGLKPEDILVIALDNRNARTYFERLSVSLVDEGVNVNDVLGNPFGQTTFAIDGKVTLSTVYRAKGNEAAAVVILGIDAIYPERKSKVGRNKIFTAFTRSKAWLRVSGMGDRADFFFKELRTALGWFPEMHFVYPDPKVVETLQRNVNSKAEAKKVLKEKYIKELKKLGLDNDDVFDFFDGDVKS